MNAGFVAKVDKSTMTVNIVRIVYGGIEPHAVSTFLIFFLLNMSGNRAQLLDCVKPLFMYTMVTCFFPLPLG